MHAIELYRLGRFLTKLAEQAMPPSDVGELAISVRSVLIDVVGEPDSAIGEIADRTGLPQSQVSSAVALLRDRGVLVTARDPDDGRRTLVRAVPDAERRAAELMARASVDEVVTAAVGSDDPRVAGEVLAVLDVLAHWLLRAPASDGDRERRRAGQGIDFDELYRQGTPPWEIGRPQAAFRDLAGAGGITGRVLDVGCGTGEHVLLAAALGLEAVGVDLSPTAIEVARGRATGRGLPARFEVLDVADLTSLGTTFDTVLDCGLFHTLSDEAIPGFVAALAAVLRPGGRIHLLCVSDRQPGHAGPRRVSEQLLRSTFTDGWDVEAIEAAELEVAIGSGALAAWLATIVRRDAAPPAPTGWVHTPDR